jgi:hypothetical protein
MTGQWQVDDAARREALKLEPRIRKKVQSNVGACSFVEKRHAPREDRDRMVF